MSTSINMALKPSKALLAALWGAQILLALVYIPAGGMKLLAPVAEVAANIPWAGDVSETFVRFIGIVDLAAGLGVLLPTLTRVAPQMTVLACLGSVALQLCAMGFHLSLAEYSVLPFNLLLVALALFVAWGRSSRARILPRGSLPVGVK